MKNTKPSIRFAGFTDDWEERKLGEVSKIKTGSSDLQDASENGAYPFFVRSEHIERSNRYLFDGEAILIPGEGRLGEIYHYINGKFDFHQRVYKISDFSTFKVSGLFILYSMKNSFKRHAMKFTVKATVDSLRLPMLTDFNLKLPSIREQQKIGSFFKQLDNTIDLHQRQLDLLKEQKKGFLQKMFPKQGAKVPELRFAGFTDDWVQRNLSDVAKVFDGTHQTPDYKDSGVPFVSVENISSLKTNKYITEQDFARDFKTKPEQGDVLMTRIGDIGTANVIRNDGPIAYYVSLALLKPQSTNSEFLKYLIGSYVTQRQLWRRTLHVAFPKKINKGEIGEVPVTVPSEAEQNQIGHFFDQLDNLIADSQRQLDLITEQKKGFLQQMFV